MARIKHIAIRTEDVEKTAAFYKEAFGLKQVGLGQNGIYLTDGHLNIAVLKFQPHHRRAPHLGQFIGDLTRPSLLGNRESYWGCDHPLGAELQKFSPGNAGLS